MGVERSADWYDEQYKTWPYLRSDPERTPWTPVWMAILGFIQPSDLVLDLGCGPGHLAALRCQRDPHIEQGGWIGIDFSQEAIDAARARGLRAGFRRGNIIDDVRSVEVGLADVVVLCEVLEHIEDDIGVLYELPRGKRVIFSVPNFDSSGHVRWFDSMFDVLNRYADVIAIGETLIVRSSNPERWWYVVTGARR